MRVLCFIPGLFMFSDHPRSNQSIKIDSTRSLIFGFGAILGLMGVLVFLRSYELQVTQDKIHHIVNNHMTKINLAVQMRSAARERTLGLQRMILTSDPFTRDDEWLRFNHFGAEFARARMQILSMGLTPQESKLLDYQNELTQKAVELQKRVISLIDQDKLNEARDVLIKGAIPAQDQVLNQLTAFYNYHERESETAARNTEASYRELQSLIYIFSTLAVLLGIAIAYYVIKRSSNAEQALSRAYCNLQLQNEEKSQFLSNLIREYKTPLNAIRKYNDYIIQNIGNRKNDCHYLLSDAKKIQSACQYLDDLTSEIIDLTKYEAGKVVITPITFNIQPLVKEVTEQIKPIVAKNNNRLDLKFHGEVNQMTTDPAKLRQILLNLLTNACKYTEFGLITLSVKSEINKGENFVLFSVVDTGVGIAPEYFDEIFVPHLESNDRPLPGAVSPDDSGLSLSISRRICLMMGGELKFNSEPGIGSTFTIKLPQTYKLFVRPPTGER